MNIQHFKRWKFCPFFLFFNFFFGSFFPPGSGSAICMWIRIQQLKLMRIRIWILSHSIWTSSRFWMSLRSKLEHYSSIYVSYKKPYLKFYPVPSTFVALQWFVSFWRGLSLESQPVFKSDWGSPKGDDFSVSLNFSAKLSRKRCSGSVTFWHGSGSYSWLHIRILLRI